LTVLGCYDFRFKTSRNSHIIEVNLYDEIDFICPYTPFEFNESKQEFYVVYQVRCLWFAGLYVVAYDFSTAATFDCSIFVQPANFYRASA